MQQVASRLGFSRQLYGVPYGSDASKLERVGVPSILYGPGSITQAHTDDEYVPVAEVEQAAQFYIEVAREFGKGF